MWGVFKVGGYVYVCVYVFVCMYLCMYVYMYVFMYVYVYAYMYVCIYIYMWVYMYICNIYVYAPCSGVTVAEFGQLNPSWISVMLMTRFF